MDKTLYDIDFVESWRLEGPSKLEIGGIRCGDVLFFAGVAESFLDALENLYKTRIPHERHAPHTYAIFLTRQNVKQSWVESHPYYLIWKPFFGVRWVTFTYVAYAYSRLKTMAGAMVNLNLGIEELEVKQDHFNEWRGDEITEKLKAHVLRKDLTEKFQARMEEVASAFREGKYKPTSKIFSSRPDMEWSTEWS
ncbi:MAG: hypothetical protein ACW99U_10265 [Candidatus Thorarchaeota archaeon]